MSEWKKVRLGDVCKIEKGSTGIASAIPGEYPLVVTAAERKTSDSYQFDCAAVCIPLVSSKGHGVKALNHVHYQNGKFALGSILCAVIPKNEEELDARYLHQYLQFYKDSLLVRLMKGAANVSLSMKDIATVEVPLPPINKQKELAEMFVKLQEKSVRIQEEFEKEKNYIKQLRQNILQDAIEGKLTENWRNKHPVQKGNPDYDAEALLSVLSVHSHHQNCVENEPLTFPCSWCRTTLGVVSKINGGFSFKSENYVQEGIRVIRISDFSEKGFVNNKIVRHKFAEGMRPFCLELENILMALTGGTVGKTFFVESINEVMVVNQRVATIKPILVESRYVDILLKSKMAQTRIQKYKHSSNDNISLPVLTNMPFPLPALNEQREICESVKKYFSKIDCLEQQIITRETLAKTLLQTTLQTTFQEG